MKYHIKVKVFELSKIDSSKLTFRSGSVEDSKWITETLNTPEVAKFLIGIYPLTEHEVKQHLKEALKEEDRKYIVAEYEGVPVGHVGIGPSKGRSRHISWLGIWVRREWWGRGIGTALMQKAVAVAGDYGCKRLMLGVFSGNERALNLYRKIGFNVDLELTDIVLVDGKWRNSIIMGLDLSDLQPRISPSEGSMDERIEVDKLRVRQLMDDDLDELNRLQNCPESTKSSSRIPPIPKEKTKQWYESLSVDRGKFCLACFEGKKLLGYLRYQTSPPPFTYIWTEEFIVDVNEKPYTAANALLSALKEFSTRYGYRKIIADIPATSIAINKAFKQQNFTEAGRMKAYYYIDRGYVDAIVYAFPTP